MSTPAAAVERVLRLDTCAVSDALDVLTLPGALPAFGRWGPRTRMAGWVSTVALEPGVGPEGRSHLGTRVLAAAGPGSVIVVANQGRTEAGAWGGLLTLQAQARGVSGVIVDGAVRDADEIDELGVPVLARGATPTTARGRYFEAENDVRVLIDGVGVEPGALALADGSGVAFVAAADVARVLALAEEIAEEEAGMAADLRIGLDGRDVMDARYERRLGRRDP